MDVETGTSIERSHIDPTCVIRKHNVIYDSTIGRNTKVGSHCTIGGVSIGANCKIEDHAFIPPGVTLGNNVFVGPHVCFTNDKYPDASPRKWTKRGTVVEDGASIGANCTILCGITVGAKSMVGAGSVVTKDVPAGATVYGNGAEER
jgi:acetyltransferase-like isoleucine patch superfamily enzyme